MRKNQKRIPKITLLIWKKGQTTSKIIINKCINSPRIRVTMSIKKKSPFSEEKKASFYCLISMHFNALKFNFEWGLLILSESLFWTLLSQSAPTASQKARSLGHLISLTFNEIQWFEAICWTLALALLNPNASHAPPNLSVLHFLFLSLFPLSWNFFFLSLH